MDLSESTEAALCELLQLCAVGDAAHVEAMLAKCEERGIGADLLVDGDDEDRPLLEAARNGHSAVVRALLEAGADPNARLTDDGTTPLHSAISCQSPGEREAVLAALLARGADPEIGDSDGFTPLIDAARDGKLGAVECLLKAGANVNTKAKGGETALLWAARCTTGRALQVVKVLLDAGGDPCAATTDDGYTPVYEAQQPVYTAADVGVRDAVRALLLEAGGREETCPHDSLGCAHEGGGRHLHVFSKANDGTDFTLPNGRTGWAAGSGVHDGLSVRICCCLLLAACCRLCLEDRRFRSPPSPPPPGSQTSRRLALTPRFHHLSTGAHLPRGGVRAARPARRRALLALRPLQAACQRALAGGAPCGACSPRRRG
jgi:hypothetical protein